MNTSGSSRMPFMHHQQHTNSLNLSLGQAPVQPFYTSLGNPNLSFPASGTTASSMISPNQNSFPSNPMNDYLDQHMHSSQQSMNTQNYGQPTPPDQSKSLGSLTVADLTSILQPIQSSIQDLKTTINHQMGALQTKVQVLENELKKEVTKNEQLTSVIVTMQKKFKYD